MMLYHSRYTNKEIYPAQKAAEIMCERKAASFNKELPRFFWELSEWKQYFLYQVKFASPLIKNFGEEKVFQALDEYKFLTSLNSPWLRKQLRTYEVKNKPKKSPAVTESLDTKTFSRSNKVEKKLDG